MGLFSNITSSLGLTRRDTIDIDAEAAFRPIDFVNEILGVTGKREQFTRADGTKGFRFVASGATEEQNDFINSLTNDIQSLVGDITELSRIGAAIDNEAFDPVINALRANAKDAREQAFQSTSRIQEENLARRGLEDSTAAIENRQQLGAGLAKAEIDAERNLVLMAEQLRDQQINRSGLGLAANQTERGNLSTGAVNERSGSINLAVGQQNQILAAQKAMELDRQAANQQQGSNFISTATRLATGGFGGSGFGFGGSAAVTSPVGTGVGAVNPATGTTAGFGSIPRLNIGF